MSDYLRLLVIFIAAVNPAGVVLAARHIAPDRDHRTRPGTVALGVAIAAILFVIAAVSAESLLDGLDVAPETFRIAAGIVMATVGIFAIWRARVAAAPVEEGWQDGIFPLALPLLAGPAGLVAAMSYGIDDGRGVTLAAALTVVAASAVFVATLPVRRAVPALDALARVTGALLVVLAAGLIVEGVRDI